MKYIHLKTVGEEVIRRRKIYNGAISDQRTVELVEEERAERLAAIMRDIPLDFKDADLVSLGYKGDELLDGLKDIFSPDETFGMLLTGPVGSGKTYAMYAMWKWIAEYDPLKCVFFENYSNYMQRLRKEFMDGTYEDQASWWDLSTNKKYPGIVMIDDIGTSKFSDFELEKLYLLLDTRNSWHAPTIVSTNIEFENLGELLGDRIASRLGRLRHVQMVPTDLRNQNERVDIKN